MENFTSQRKLSFRPLCVARAFNDLQILTGVKDGVIRSSLHSQKRTHDILCATEERIAALKVELAESEHHVVGLSTGEVECFNSACSRHARCSQRHP